MIKRPVLIHLAWGAAMVGAWWLGDRNENPGGTTGPWAKGAMSAQPAAWGERMDIKPAARMREEAAFGVTAAWLTKWVDGNGTIPPENMTSAVMEALADPDSVCGMRHFTHLLECLTADNAPAALAALKNHSGPAETALWVSLFCTAWGGERRRSRCDRGLGRAPQNAFCFTSAFPQTLPPIGECGLF